MVEGVSEDDMAPCEPLVDDSDEELEDILRLSGEDEMGDDEICQGDGVCSL